MIFLLKTNLNHLEETKPKNNDNEEKRTSDDFSDDDAEINSAIMKKLKKDHLQTEPKVSFADFGGIDVDF